MVKNKLKSMYLRFSPKDYKKMLVIKLASRVTWEELVYASIINTNDDIVSMIKGV